MENIEEARKEVMIAVGEEEEGLSHMNHAECDPLLQASMRKKGSAKSCHREAESESEVARGAREAIEEKSSCH